jgi:hypothetical protein
MHRFDGDAFVDFIRTCNNCNLIPLEPPSLTLVISYPQTHSQAAKIISRAEEYPLTPLFSCSARFSAASCARVEPPKKEPVIVMSSALKIAAN